MTATSTPALALPDLFTALFSDEGRQDPYPFLHRYDGAGVHHGLVTQLLRDARFGPPDFSSDERPFWNMFGQWLINLDGPAHDVMRALAAAPFARSTLDSYRAAVDGHIDRLLGDVQDAAIDGPVDLVAMLASPLPVAVICSLLGLPDADRPQIDEWLRAMARSFAGQRDPAVLATGDRTVEELRAYLGPLVRSRATPAGRGEDLLSRIAADPTVPFDRVVSNAIFLLIAGQETTMSAIATCLHLLLTHPEQLALARSRPELLDGAVEEALRYESPTQIAFRRARSHVELDGWRFPAGEPVPLFLGAANRDPEAFADPDRFDITRSPNPHVAFAGGRHFCLGAPLARLQTTSAVGAVLARFPGLALAAEPRWLSALPLRTLDSLVVAAV